MKRLAYPLMDAVSRIVQRVDGTWAWSFAQEGEDMLLRRILGAGRHGFYIDIGAHHPRRFSNTHWFYSLGWRGVNIEPSPAAISEFERYRPRDINLCLGIAEAPGTLTYFVFDEPALNTFDEELKRDRELRTQYRVVQTVDVRVERLDITLGRVLPPEQRIDFMSIDVEGLDLQVLRSNDWDRYRPRLVLVEALDFILERADAHPIHRHMKSAGYELVAKTMNTLFYREAR